MATVESVANGALAAIRSEASLLLVAQWVQRRYEEIVSRVRFRHLRQPGLVVIPGVMDTGLATATRGSTIVTGNSAAQTAWSAGSLVGRWFKTRVAWYEIVQSTTSLKLKVPFSEDSVTAGNYDIVSRYVTLDPQARHLGSFVHLRRRLPIDAVDPKALDARAPSRQMTTVGPQVYAEMGHALNEDGQRARRLEFYPYSDNDEVIGYNYWEAAPKLALRDELPYAIDENVLIEGVLIDLMRYEMARAWRAGKNDEGNSWRNEGRAQKTSWEREVMQAIRTDTGVDDVTFILERGPAMVGNFDIRTAEDHVLAGWSR